MKFKVGDMVKYIPEEDFANQNIYRIIGIDTQCTNFPYFCKGTDGFTFWFREENLALVEKDSKERENKMKVFKKEDSIRKLGDLRTGDFFQILKGKYKGRYGFICAIDCGTELEDDSEKQAVIFLDNDWPYYCFAVVDRNMAVKKIPGEIRVEED